MGDPFSVREGVNPPAVVRPCAWVECAFWLRWQTHPYGRARNGGALSTLNLRPPAVHRERRLEISGECLQPLRTSSAGYRVLSALVVGTLRHKQSGVWRSCSTARALCWFGRRASRQEARGTDGAVAYRLSLSPAVGDKTN